MAYHWVLIPVVILWRGAPPFMTDSDGAMLAPGMMCNLHNNLALSILSLEGVRVAATNVGSLREWSPTARCGWEK